MVSDASATKPTSRDERRPQRVTARGQLADEVLTMVPMAIGFSAGWIWREGWPTVSLAAVIAVIIGSLAAAALFRGNELLTHIRALRSAGPDPAPEIPVSVGPTLLARIRWIVGVTAIGVPIGWLAAGFDAGVGLIVAVFAAAPVMVWLVFAVAECARGSRLVYAPRPVEHPIDVGHGVPATWWGRVQQKMMSGSKLDDEERAVLAEFARLQGGDRYGVPYLRSRGGHTDRSPH